MLELLAVSTGWRGASMVEYRGWIQSQVEHLYPETTIGKLSVENVE